MTENYLFSPMELTNVSMAMDSLCNTANRLNDPELNLAVAVLKRELDSIPKSISINLEINSGKICKADPCYHSYHLR